MTYTVVLLVLAIRAQERGNSAWTTGVRDGGLFYPNRTTTGGAPQVQTALATVPQAYSLPQPQLASPQQPPLQQSPPVQAYAAYPSPYPTIQV